MTNNNLKKKDFKIAGVLVDEMPHYIDHLPPLCKYLNIPLFVNEVSIEEDILKYYPDIDVTYIPTRDFPKFLARNFDGIVTCFGKEYFSDQFFGGVIETIKKMKYYWLPHGNSDKGRNLGHLSIVQGEDHALIYGDHMKDAFGEIKTNIKFTKIGNYRKHFFNSNKNFFKKIFDKEVFSKLNSSAKKTVLYAPTWENNNDYSSIDYYDQLIEGLYDNWNMIIKIHPNSLIQKGIDIERMKFKYRNKKNVLFLEKFPPIYPLIDFCDVYIGDMSSIGYDFLTSYKPMFFINSQKADPKTNKNLFLYQAGVEIPVGEYRNLSAFLEKHLIEDEKKHLAIRKKLSKYSYYDVMHPDLLLKSLIY
jgi:teichoic acid glycerol-phosphate primase